jgi:hypothetical protein
MTANELADELDKMIPALPLTVLIKSATMLRQQQAEIDAFKLNYYNTGYSLQLRDKDETIKQQQSEIEALKKELALQKLSDIGQEIENEPVAWIARGDNTSVFFDLDCALSIDDSPTPLYTHPMRELTDEEINKLWAESHEDGIAMQQGFTTQQHYFAHLILKKASDK